MIGPILSSGSQRFQCTKHDSQYQPDGLHTAGRATRNLDRYVIRRDGDSVVVTVNYDYKMMWPLAIGTVIHMSSTSEMRLE